MYEIYVSDMDDFANAVRTAIRKVLEDGLELPLYLLQVSANGNMTCCHVVAGKDGSRTALS